jgi:hypothetical protein
MFFLLLIGEADISVCSFVTVVLHAWDEGDLDKALIADCGLRIEEILQLCPAHFAIADCRLRFKKSAIRNPTTSCAV